ncbi:MAG: S8 family serine peptidase [Rhodospirillales bacterium]|nr:S8 family serine peptidase [Rhodospirillales bacterium]
MNASQGYANRTTGRPGGRGITVAVLDDGVDFNHPDIDGGQYDSQFTFPGVATAEGHGTNIAGVIAGRRDGRGVHGIAYAANIVSIATCFQIEECAGPVPDVGSADETAADIASAAGLDRTYGPSGSSVSSSPDASSHIINMSFAYDGIDNIPQITSAMRDAAAAGRIMVAALGNEAIIGPAGAPASNVADSGIAGYAIAVGALDPTGNTDAGFSNTCHGVANYCLFAPGESIVTTRAGGGHETVHGTSFAAPYVAGAAAVLWAAFPNKRGNQIVQRLLSTASPLGGQSFSQYFGHGALDLGAAMSPVGFISLSTAGGSMVPVADSYVALPPGFSAPEVSKGLANTVVYDEQMFPFHYDLANSFHGSERRAEGMLREFLSSLGKSSNVSLDRADASLKFVHDDDPSNNPWDATSGDAQDELLDVYRLDFAPVPGLTVAVGQGFGSIGSSNDFIGSRTQRTIFNDEFTVAPFAAFAGPGPVLTVDWEVDDGTTIDLVGKEGRGYGGSSSAQLASLGLTREIGEGVTFGARYGTLREQGSMMGIRAEGALANAGRATTDFVDISVNGRVSDDLTVFGGMSHGITGGGTPGSESTLVSEWSDARAGAFVIGTEFEKLWQDSDRLTVTASSPFRADSATIHIDVPDREVADTVVGYTARAIDLVPSGREHRVQWVYEMKADEALLPFGGDAVSILLGSYVRMEPGHDETADPEFGAAAKIRARF